MIRKSVVAAGAVAAVAALALAGCTSTASADSASAGGKQTLELYTDSDTNVQTLWTNTLIPAYEKAHPNITLKLTAGDSSQDTTQLAKLSASVKLKRAPSMDVIIDAGFLPDADSAGDLLALSTSNVPNLKEISASVIPGKGELPYRGSSVVIAYDSTKVKTPPASVDALVAWIKSHPGQFTYNTPSTGGSGEGFVQAVLDSKMSAADTAAMVTGYQPALQATAWKAGLAELKSLTPYVYQHTYPNGNQAALDLLGAGQISITSTWSDMFLSSIANGQLASTFKAETISDPSLPGGVSSLGIAKNSTHSAAALQLLNWVLQPTQQATIATTLSGYPAIPLADLPAADRTQFSGLNTGDLRPFYSAQTSADMASAWQKSVP